jgi:hypothetical protein
MDRGLSAGSNILHGAFLVSHRVLGAIGAERSPDVGEVRLHVRISAMPITQFG